MNLNLILIFATLYLGIFLYIVMNHSLISMCEIEKCPYCYGTDLCDDFKENKLKLRDSSIFHIFSNYFSVKNVYYAIYNNNSVVLKKLAHNSELHRFDALICINNNLSRGCDIPQLIEEQNKPFEQRFNFTFFNKTGMNFRLCAEAITFYRSLVFNYLQRHGYRLSMFTYAKHMWASLELNIEQLLIQLFKYEDYWPVPQYLGACGRLIVENDCGSTLNYFADADWNIRAKITLQLLHAAKNFTEKHDLYRIYLTDISPDNIAVDADLRVTFVDLENVILTAMDYSGADIHHSIDLDDEENFGYFEDELCVSTLSDHNYYGVCKILLSKNAPWPMMNGGLLHSPPKDVVESFPDLFELIEICVHNSERINRFEAVEKMMDILEKIVLK